MTHRHFHGLQANVYEHPFDSRARKSLEKTPGLSLVFKKINEYGIDRLFRFRCTANAIRITYRNFPAIYSAFEMACETLAVDPIPSLYLIHGEGYIRTLTIGVSEPIVIINVDAVERLTEQEWLYVLGHELGHIKSSHLLYHQTAIVLPILGKFIASSTLGLGGIATNGIELALYQWMMMAKLTCDRAGLLACQDTTVATRALIKLAGLPEAYLSQAVIDEFLDQSREFGGYDLDNLDKITKILSFAENMRPWVILRAAELLKWIDGGVYNSIVEGTYLFLEGDGRYGAEAGAGTGDQGAKAADTDADWGLEDWGSAGPGPMPGSGSGSGIMPGFPGDRSLEPRVPRSDRSIPSPAAAGLGPLPEEALPRRSPAPLGSLPPLVEEWTPTAAPWVDRSDAMPPLPDRPISDRPISDRPMSDRPTPDRPVSDRPISDRPVFDLPMSDRPISERPMPDRPISDWPVSDQPMPDRFVSDRPMPDRFVSDLPMSDRPISERPMPDRPAPNPPAPDRSASDRPSERGKGRRRWDPERFGVGINGDGEAPRRDRPPLDPLDSSLPDRPPLDRPPISLPPPNRPPAANRRPPIDRLGDWPTDGATNRPADRPLAPRDTPNFPDDRPPLPPLPRPNRSPADPSARRPSPDPGNPSRGDRSRGDRPLPPLNGGRGPGGRPEGRNGAGNPGDRAMGNPAAGENNSEAESDWGFLDSWKIS